MGIVSTAISDVVRRSREAGGAQDPDNPSAPTGGGSTKPPYPLPGGSTKPPAPLVPSQDVPPTPATPQNTPPPSPSTPDTPPAPPAPAPAPGPAPGTGAVNTAITTATGGPLTAPAPTDPGASTTQGGPVLRDVQDRETTAGQLALLMQSDNPVIAQARANAVKLANERGLANSSMAAGAGEEAAIGAMVPVATNTAGAFERGAMANQDVENQFGQMHETFAHQDTMQGKDIAATAANVNAQVAASMADSAARVSLGNAQIASSERMQSASLTASERIANLQANTQLTVSDRTLAHQTELFNSDASLRRELNLQGLQEHTQATYTQQLSTILTDPNMGADDKDRAIRNLNAVYAGSPYMPVGINTTGLPPRTNTTPPPPPPPPNTGGGG
jgi:hypothetical protein